MIDIAETSIRLIGVLNAGSGPAFDADQRPGIGSRSIGIVDLAI